tara:strand:- start:384 stop:689 length:306 start_codon:yes stop_codon:yes gene_type:complete
MLTERCFLAAKSRTVVVGMADVCMNVFLSIYVSVRGLKCCVKFLRKKTKRAAHDFPKQLIIKGYFAESCFRPMQDPFLIRLMILIEALYALEKPIEMVKKL